MSKNITPEELLATVQAAQKELYNAGLNGEVFTAFSNLTVNTTSEEKAQMIDNEINTFCSEQGSISQPQELREAMQLIDEAVINSYLEGLSARKESCAPGKESA
jgi:hypothetical protein